MDKETIEKIKEGAAAQARAVLSLRDSDGWKITQTIIEKNLAKFLKKVKASRKAGDFFCAKCETETLMKEIDNEIMSLVNNPLLTRP